MTTTNTILSTLCVRYLDYDNYRESCFWNWCKNYSLGDRMSLQSMVKHDGLRNWYQDQWLNLVERKFLIDCKDYLKLEDMEPELMELFLTYPISLHEFYPKPLLEMIKNETNGKHHKERSRTANY